MSSQPDDHLSEDGVVKSPHENGDSNGFGDAPSGSKRMEYRSKVGELGKLIGEDDMPGQKTFDQLSLYEKKSVLINRELDLMGMGRYQWCIFFLCGCGYFLDLCWAQAGGLVASAIIQEMGIKDTKVGDLSTAFNVGLTTGAFTWGLLVDIIGRRWCFNLTCLIAAIFGFLLAAPSNWGAVCFFYCLIGFGVGGNIPIDAIITLEFLPKNRRYLLATLSTFQPVGTVTASLLAYGLVPKYSCDDGAPACSTGQIPCCTKRSNMGWRYTMIVLGCITLCIFIMRFVVFRVRESPKFLLAKGHDAHALDVVHYVARFNRRPIPKLDLDDFLALDFEESQRSSISGESTAPILGGEPEIIGQSAFSRVILGTLRAAFGHLKGLFRSGVYTYLFIMLAIAYMADFWAFSVAGYFLPLILRAKGVDTEGGSTARTYRSYIYIYLPGITATFIASVIMEIPKVGRKWAMVISAILMGVSLGLYHLVDTFAASVGFNAMEYWFQSLYNALLYAYTPEAFPAPFRGSACGMLSTIGRISGIVAPVATASVYHGADSPGVLWLGAGGAWMSAVAVALLPETRGKQTY